MNKDTILAWFRENNQNFNALRVNREPYMMALDEAVSVWAAAGYPDNLIIAVVNAVGNFCLWHNYSSHPRGNGPT